jgi:hypothetical protein
LSQYNFPELDTVDADIPVKKEIAPIIKDTVPVKLKDTVPVKVAVDSVKTTTQAQIFASRYNSYCFD